MIENTLENKAKFFALYWGYEYTGSDYYTYMMPDTWHEFPSCIEHQYLILKSILKISDEDIRVVAKLIGQDRSEDFFTVEKRIVLSYLREYSMPSLEIGKSENIISYLRSKGYALDYLGTSVDTLIEYGWVKLKEVQND